MNLQDILASDRSRDLNLSIIGLLVSDRRSDAIT